MNTIKSTTLCFICSLLLLLTACGGGTSGENGNDPFNGGDGDAVDQAPSLAVTILDAQCVSPLTSIELGETLCVEIVLTDSDSSIASELISLTTTLGQLAVSDRLTNNSGVAQVLLSSETATLGAGQVTASYIQASTATTITDFANFEFVANTTAPIANANLTLAITDALGNASNSVNIDESLSLNALLLDAQGLPAANQIVEFQTTIGTLLPQSSLTNAQGIASSLLTPQDTLGAGTITITTTLSDSLLTASQNIEVLAANSTEVQSVRLGSFSEGVFIEGLLGTDGFASGDDVAISAGGTLGFNLALVDSNDNLLQTNLPVSFTSVCVQSSDASIDNNTISVNGIARATYQDLACAGTSGNDDVITASVTLDGLTLNASRVVSIEPESVGSITFIDAAPSNIVLLGTGGQNSSTTSTVTFQVNSALDNPLAQQLVNFSLNTEVGGLDLFPEQALTNSEGQVSTRVTAGTVPTSIRVSAQVTTDQNDTIQTQSDLLTVNTGLPDQDSFSLALSNLNPEAFGVTGQTVQAIVQLSDSFNNPVPDGTAVSFTAEGGSIEPSCTTVNGTCSVTWTSGQPQITNDHRVTILATALGHETLVDSDGNNLYSVEDGDPLLLDDGSGFNVILPTETGFIDLPEAWLDANENGVRDITELFLDLNASGSYDSANAEFDGPQCVTGCGADSLHVRRANVIVTSSSTALLSVSDGVNELTSSTAPILDPVASVEAGESINLFLTFNDTAGQPIASGSTIEVTTNAGILTGVTSATMPQTNTAGSSSIAFTLTSDLAEGEPSTNASISITITSPSGVVSPLTVVVTLL